MYFHRFVRIPRSSAQPILIFGYSVSMYDQRLRHRLPLKAGVRLVPCTAARGFASHQFQQGRQHVDGARLLLYAQPAGTPGPGQQKSDAQRRVIKEHSVGVLAMLRQALAVVRQHRHQRIAPAGCSPPPPAAAPPAGPCTPPRRRTAVRDIFPGTEKADRKASGDRTNAPREKKACPIVTPPTATPGPPPRAARRSA